MSMPGESLVLHRVMASRARRAKHTALSFVSAKSDKSVA